MLDDPPVEESGKLDFLKMWEKVSSLYFGESLSLEDEEEVSCWLDEEISDSLEDEENGFCEASPPPFEAHEANKGDKTNRNVKPLLFTMKPPSGKSD